ncbi:hypothetical protein CCP2SC5_230021 [Azospirillaceae bacterium]
MLRAQLAHGLRFEIVIRQTYLQSLTLPNDSLYLITHQLLKLPIRPPHNNFAQRT